MPEEPLTPPRRGRPPTIDREVVLDTAIRAGRRGRRGAYESTLASELGVSAMAPYRYVGSKDELLMVLVDRLAARLVYPLRPHDPKAAMLVLWSTIYDSLAEHSWVPEVLARRRMMAPSVLGAIEEIHVALRAAGLSIDSTLRAYRLMWNLTLGSLLVAPARALKGRASSAGCAARRIPSATRPWRRLPRRGPRRMTARRTATISRRSSTRCWRTGVEKSRGLTASASGRRTTPAHAPRRSGSSPVAVPAEVKVRWAAGPDPAPRSLARRVRERPARRRRRGGHA